MGIANPVTRETHGSGTHYHMQLAKQLGDMLQAPLEVSKYVCASFSTQANFSHSLLSKFNVYVILIVLFLPVPSLSGTWGDDGSD